MNRDLAIAEIYYGTREPVPCARRLSAGRWSALLVDGALRDIRCDGIEIIRSIDYLVRDRDWGTCAPNICDLEVDEEADAFRVRYRADCENADGHRLGYRVLITAHTDKGVQVSATAMPADHFLAARCGLCVLHPLAGVAGAPARVEHSDGRVEMSHFPGLIDPWQPFKDIRTIEHELRPGDWVRCAFQGDIFEMEDQRNWSDASFKTYSRPLELPWPYVLEGGREFEQSISISVGFAERPEHAEHRAGIVDSNASLPEPVEIELVDDARRMPDLGLAIAPDEIDDVMRHADAVRSLRPQRLWLHFDSGAGHDVRTLARYAQLAACLEVPPTLEFALPGTAEPTDELAWLASQLGESGLKIAGLMISPSVHRQSNPPGSVSPPCPPLDAVYRAARSIFPGVYLSGGMLSYFTELNRKRPPLSMVDEVVHATCPIVHAADDVSVMQTLEAIPHIARSCRALIGNQAYSIGPLTIGMRQNPYGSRTMPNPHGRRVAMTSDDPRQRGLFAAAWMVGYVAALADADLRSLVLGALTGPRGMLDEQGRAYPAFAIASEFSQLGGRRRIRCASSDSASVVAFAGYRADGARVVVVANLTAESRTFRFAGQRTASGFARSRNIDEATFGEIRTGTTQWIDDVLDDRIRLLKPLGCVVLADV